MANELARQESQPPERKPVPLKKGEVRFEIKAGQRLFIIRCFAAFDQPAEVTRKLMQEYSDLLETDVTRHTPELVYDYLLKRVQRLNPDSKHNREHGNIGKELLALFDKEREEYLSDYSNVYLAHRRNRVRELEQLYRIQVDRLLAAGAEGDATKEMQNALKILSEIRSEMTSRKINLEATVDEDGKAQMALRTSVENLSDDQLQRLMKQHERGEQISIPANNGAGANSRDAVSSGAGGDETPGTDGGRTSTTAD